MNKFFVLGRAVLVGSGVYVAVLYLTLHVPWLLTHYLALHPSRWGQVGKALLDNVPASLALLSSLFLNNKELRREGFTYALVTVSGVASALTVLNHNHAVIGTFKWQYAAIAVWSLTAAIVSALADIPTAIATVAIASIMYEAFWVPIALNHFTEPKGWASVATLATKPRVKAVAWLALGVLASWVLWPAITCTPLYPLVRVPTAVGAVLYAREVSACP